MNDGSIEPKKKEAGGCGGQNERIVMRKSRDISERQIAVGVVSEMAGSNVGEFSLYGYYDNDINFVAGVAERLSAILNKPFISKLRCVVRHLVSCGVLVASMWYTDKYYIGDPPKQMNYRLANPGYLQLFDRDDPEFEINFLLRRAYPL